METTIISAAEAAASFDLAMAAPDLLEACRRAEIKLSAYLGVCKDDKELPKVIDMLAKAQAKAEGRQA